jgi:hypothetical protein
MKVIDLIPKRKLSELGYGECFEYFSTEVVWMKIDNDYGWCRAADDIDDPIFAVQLETGEISMFDEDPVVTPVRGSYTREN